MADVYRIRWDRDIHIWSGLDMDQILAVLVDQVLSLYPSEDGGGATYGEKAYIILLIPLSELRKRTISRMAGIKFRRGGNGFVSELTGAWLVESSQR
jgi:hypothetical protein